MGIKCKKYNATDSRNMTEESEESQVANKRQID